MGYKNNFLSRLCSYSFNKQKLSRENFLTEVFAYLFENDKTFKKIFLRLILCDGRTCFRFKTAVAETQVSYPRCFVDLVLRPQSGRPILIEVKIKASETQTKIWGLGSVPQISKYIRLRSGPVAYLTSIHVPFANVRKQKQYLGQFYIEELQQQMEKSHKLSHIGVELRRFLEEQGMAYPKPFTVKELRYSKEAFDFAAKAQELLDEVVSEYQIEFRRALRTRASFSRATFSTTDKSAYVYLKGFNKWPFKAAGFSIDSDNNSTWFSVWFRIHRETGADDQVRKADFDHESGSRYWNEVVELRGGVSDRRRISKCIEKAIKKLGRCF